MPNSKNLSLQELRGLLIIIIASGHLLQGPESAGAFDYWLCYRKITNFVVATFFFMSGYLFKQDDLNKSTLNYYKKRIPRILIPYLVWTILYASPTLINFKELTFTTVFNLIFLAKGAGHLYFLLVLVQFIILTPLFVKILQSKKKLGTILLFISSPLFICYLYYYNISTNSMMPNYAPILFCWSTYYILGLTIKCKPISLNWSYITRFSLIILTLLLSIGEAYILYHHTGFKSFACSQITFGSFLYSLAIFTLLFSPEFVNKQPNHNKLLVNLGNYSWGISLVHLNFAYLVYAIPTQIITSPERYLILQFLGTLFTLVASYIVVRVSNWILPTTINRYLGFK